MNTPVHPVGTEPEKLWFTLQPYLYLRDESLCPPLKGLEGCEKFVSGCPPLKGLEGCEKFVSGPEVMVPGCVVWCRVPCFFLFWKAEVVRGLKKKKNIILRGFGNPWQVPQVDEGTPSAKERATGRTNVWPHLDPRTWAHEEMG